MRTRRGAGDQADVCQFDDLAALQIGQTVGDRLRHRAQFPDREGCLDKFHAVGQSDRDKIAGLDAIFLIGPGQAVAARLQLGPAQSRAFESQHWGIRVPISPIGKDTG